MSERGKTGKGNSAPSTLDFGWFFDFVRDLRAFFPKNRLFLLWMRFVLGGLLFDVSSPENPLGDLGRFRGWGLREHPHFRRDV